MKQIQIFDTTLRDGEQSPGCSMNIKEKIKVAKQLEKLNVDVIEAGFAASSLKDKEAIIKISKAVETPIITSLARLVKRDIDEAYESLKYAKKKRIHVFIATSDIHMKYKLKMTKEQVLSKVSELVKYAKSKVDDIEFSAEDATRSDKDFLCQVYSCAIEAGANVINIPDTVGYMLPEEYMEFVNYIKKHTKNIDSVIMSSHCHNDLGLAVANSVAGVKMGIEQVECTINGIGERAGNSSLEQIVAILDTRKNYFDATTNINKNCIKKASQLICDITNQQVERNKPIVGENAFKHESGIHQHGVLNAKETYEILKAEDYGITTDHIVLGIHSGKHAIISKMKDCGYDIDNYDISNIVEKIKNWFSFNKDLSDDNFKTIVEQSKNSKIYQKK